MVSRIRLAMSTFWSQKGLIKRKRKGKKGFVLFWCLFLTMAYGCNPECFSFILVWDICDETTHSWYQSRCLIKVEMKLLQQQKKRDHKSNHRINDHSRIQISGPITSSLAKSSTCWELEKASSIWKMTRQT